jgi:hypothetical protein
MDDLVHSFLHATGKHHPMLPVRIPGKAGHAHRAGDNLVLAGASVGNRTWSEFLSEQTEKPRSRSEIS